MRYMVMHYETQAMEDGVLPSPEEQAAIGESMTRNSQERTTMHERAARCAAHRDPSEREP
jgi:hypothetical protein